MTVLSKSMFAARTMTKTVPIFNPAANVLYHIAKTKMDREPCFNMTKLCAQDDEHFKGIGCNVGDATPYFDQYLRDALRYSYSMVAYDAEVPVGMSLVTVRNREKELDGMNMLGAAPARTNYTPLDDVLRHCQDIFWKSNPTVYRVSSKFVYDTFFVRIEYGVVPKKLTLNIRADFLFLGVFDYADYEYDG
ncbi:hypothetical protein WR25_14102 [Diploscapter pachys]|uniref:Uncharacterized protein n=1 Tax=Diploscapter pachys TaxID=2018661 RepID=A0A2A2JG89_9BILA|nr:hypothetical protein WR25_14102 [Diploscapter pachys]